MDGKLSNWLEQNLAIDNRRTRSTGLGVIEAKRPVLEISRKVFIASPVICIARKMKNLAGSYSFCVSKK